MLKHPAAVLGLIMIPLSHAHASAQISGWESHGNTTTHFSHSDENVPVKHNYTTPGEYSPIIYPEGAPTGNHTVGYADAASQTLRASAYSWARPGQNETPSNSAQSVIAASFDKTLTVNAGSSGLSVGDPVTLRLAINFDGIYSTHQGCTTIPCVITYGYDVSDGGWVDVNAGYRITNPNHLVGSGNRPEVVADFSFHAKEDSSSRSWGYIDRVYGTNYPWWIDKYDPDHDGMSDMSEDWWWSASSNSIETAADSGHNTYNGPFGRVFSGTAPNIVQTIDFQTYIGAQLAISAGMDISTYVYYHGDAGEKTVYGNFMNTFSSGITSLNAPGIELSYIVAAPVPLPGAAWLFLSGLMGFLALRRGKTAISD
ncbi:VPLPA-CTERM sorting domain-containing protein [Methylomonas sp. LL1]|uniref:VPLPA-CTERM sorting domain-containing protein n=1 Tax=Methylomonas sp. LL1 TaxID=2785785 RepID=UPI0018C3AAB8|nr:VPLPA-CTERM sorting domain-containing protein [Methylomonas sp. LL1]QPK64971.1 VPLPA-CTERM sorting domain-containing protein [Methylomonas sp. LL1]